MQRWLVFAILLVLLALPSQAGAQSGTELNSINIEFWAEYDQPSMLVIQEFTVAEGTPLPAEVTLRFPADGNLIAVAFDSTGNLVNAQFSDPEKQGDWLSVTVNVQSYDPHRIEYYQPITRDGNQRQFTFTWHGDYSISGLNVNLLIPSDSTNLVTSPALSSVETSANGLFTIGTFSRGGLKMGEPFDFEIEYSRDTDAVTNPSQPGGVQPSEPIGAETAGRVSIDRVPWIIGGIGLALIAIALFTYWRSTQARERSTTRSRSRQRRHEDEEDGNTQAYCHECGTRAHAGDRFCRTCGSRLRVE